MCILRHIFSTITMRDQLYLPKAEMLWINWPTDPDIMFIAWELFCGSAVWTAALSEFSLIEHLPDSFPSDSDVQLSWHSIIQITSISEDVLKAAQQTNVVMQRERIQLV